MPAPARSPRLPRRTLHPRRDDGWTRPAWYIDRVGQWLHSRPWCAFATLTFSIDVVQLRADRAIERWVRSVARQTGQHVTIAYASDYQVGGFVHFHALLAYEFPFAQRGRALEPLHRLWAVADREAGWTYFRRYDPARGAAWYTAGHREVAVGIACPRRCACRRSAGCRLSRCPI